MKKVLNLILAIVFAISIFVTSPLTPAANAAGVGDLTFEINEDGETYSVSGCDANATGELIIPSTYNSLPVTGIGDFAFTESLLTSITIPESVTSIGMGAFYSCINLASVIIGGGVTSIGEGAFSSCDSLTSLKIPNSVTSIGGYAFESCDSLITITIPDSVTSIGGRAFASCESLVSTTIGDNVTNIGDSAFENCSSLTSVTIGDSVTGIGDSIFKNCNSLENITIGDNVTSIGDHAFEGCTTLTSVIINDNVTSIGFSAFKYCDSLASVIMGSSVSSISNTAFEYCNSLKYVFYTSSVANWSKISIGDYNSNLTSAKIHYNTIEHGHSIVKVLPTDKVTEGSIKDFCPVCDLVHHNDKLIWLNDYVAVVDTKNVVVDATNNTLILDVSACKNIREAIIEMDGYALTTTPSASGSFIGTGSKLKVSTTSGTQVAEYTLVVRGDVNGDSVCDVLDLMLIELARTNNATLTGVYFTAADLSEDGVIDLSDFSAAVNIALA